MQDYDFEINLTNEMDTFQIIHMEDNTSTLKY